MFKEHKRLIKYPLHTKIIKVSSQGNRINKVEVQTLDSIEHSNSSPKR